MDRKKKLIGFIILYLILAVLALLLLLPAIRKKLKNNPETAVMASFETLEAESSTVVAESSAIEETESTVTGTLPQTEPPTVPEPETTVPVSEVTDQTKPQLPATFVSKIKVNVNIRNSPTMKGKIIGKIPPGGQGSIQEFINTEWLKLSFNGLEGYSAFRYFTIAMPQKQEPVPTPAEPEKKQEPVVKETEPTEEVQNSIEGDEVIIVNNCYIRSSTNSHTMENVIDVAEKDSVYPHEAEKDTESWCCITLSDGRSGYVSRGYTEVIP